MLRNLPTFVMLAEERHFRRSAELLGISQSAVSRQILDLETNVGFSLLNRTTREVTLTAAGEQFLTEAKSILHQLESAITSSRAIAHGQQGIIRIGYTQPSMTAYGAAVLKSVQTTLPEIGIELHEMRTNDQVIALSNQKIDLGFLHPPIDVHGLLVTDMGNDPMMVCMRSDHPLALKKEVDMQDLRGLPFILYPREVGPHLYDAILKTCETAGFAPQITQHCTSWSTAIDLAANGLGIGWVPQAISSTSTNGVVVFRPVKRTELSLPMAIASRRKTRKSIILEFLKEAVKFAR